MSEKWPPGRVPDWMRKTYPVKSTRWASGRVLEMFILAIYGDDYLEHQVIWTYKRMEELNDAIERYISEYDPNNPGSRNFTEDVKTFVRWIRDKKYSRGSIGGALGKLKKFFTRQPENRKDRRYEILDMDMDDIKILMGKKGAVLRDKIPTKEQLKRIIMHLSIGHKAQALFLLSTGLRVGTTQKLLMKDLHLEVDPPYVDTQPWMSDKYDPPKVWFSYEARDAIIEWHKVRKTKLKKSGKPFREDLVLGVPGFNESWINALKKTGLDTKSGETPHRSQHIYHQHTLRKFFRTNMATDKDGSQRISTDIVDGLMGHKAYLAEAYVKIGEKKLAKIYKENMHAVSIYMSDEEAEQKQLTIDAKELVEYQEKGWMWRGTLPDGRVVIERKK